MKMKYALLIFTIIITIQLESTPLVPAHFFECSLAINRFTNQVHRRFYFVERLKKTMQMLAKINERIDQLSFLVRAMMKERYIMNYSFSHVRIQSSVEEIIKTKSLKPLFMIWDDFTIYKSLEDDLFVEEFTKEIFIVTKGILSDQIESNPTFKKKIKSLKIDCFHSTIYETIGSISAMTDIIVALLDHGERELEELLQDTYRDGLVDVVSEVTSEDVLTRFYYMERLHVHENMFKFFSNVSGSCFKFVIRSDQKDGQTIFDDNFEFSSPVVRRIIRQMEQKNSIEPLLRLLDDLGQFKYIDNFPFVREVLIALFLAQKNYVINMSLPNKSTKNIDTLNAIIQAYNAIEDLPIEEILEVIDLAASLYKELTKEQEDTFGWRDILASNWVVKVASLGMFVAKIVSFFSVSTS